MWGLVEQNTLTGPRAGRENREPLTSTARQGVRRRPAQLEGVGKRGKEAVMARDSKG